MLTLPIFLFFVASLTGAKTPDGRIVGGRLAKEGEFPYQVSIRHSYNDAHYCGGSLITLKHVLTAAHCVLYSPRDLLMLIPPPMVIVLAGQLGLKLTPNSVYREVAKITAHPLYDSQTFSNDVAIVELMEALPKNNLISVVPLNQQKIPANTPCIVTGWGKQNYDDYAVSPHLLAAQVNVVDFDNCQNMYNVNLSPGTMCAHNEQRRAGSCKGDSGGPLVCKGCLVGVVAFGKGCADPGVYSDVAYYLPWINETLSEDNLTVSSSGCISERL